MIDNTDPRPEIGNITADRGGWADFANVADRLVTVWHVETARAVQVFPLRLVFAVAVEHLDAMVFTVRDIDPAVGVAADVVDNVELALAGSGFAPRHQQFCRRVSICGRGHCHSRRRYKSHPAGRGPCGYSDGTARRS